MGEGAEEENGLFFPRRNISAGTASGPGENRPQSYWVRFTPYVFVYFQKPSFLSS